MDDASAGPRPFRGWWILGFCTLAITLTAPGQTVGVSAFVDHFVDDLRLSDNSVSAAYLGGTLAGSLTMTSIGKWIDRRGVRRTMLIITISFSLVVMAMSQVQNIAMLAVGFVGIRMLGQGSLSLVSQTGIALWFDQYRGLAFGLSMTFSAVFMAGGPFILTALIDAYGWRSAWVIAGATVFVLLVPGTFLLMVDRPETIGQLPDGKEPVTDVHGPATIHYTVGQAMRTGGFWALTATMVCASAFITGLTFHHFSMMADKGLTDGQAAGVFLPQMIGTLATGFAFAYMTDRVSSRPLLGLSSILLALGMISYRWVEPGIGAVLYGVLIGLNAGSIRALGSALYPKWFGTANIGAIRGVSTQFGVAASAIGPLIIAAGEDVAGSYDRLLLVLSIVPIAAGVAGIVVASPRARPMASSSV